MQNKTKSTHIYDFTEHELIIFQYEDLIAFEKAAFFCRTIGCLLFIYLH